MLVITAYIPMLNDFMLHKNAEAIQRIVFCCFFFGPTHNGLVGSQC